LFGIDAEVMTVDRGEDLFDWNIIGGKPVTKLTGPTCGLHWPNLLHPDPERNPEIVSGWVNFLAPYNNQIETLLAPDSVFFQQQLAHHICTEAVVTGPFIDLDFEKTSALPEPVAGHQLVIKLRSKAELQFTAENIKIISHSFVTSKDDLLYTIKLERISKNLTARIEYSKAV
jgi:hypothetical protein